MSIGFVETNRMMRLTTVLKNSNVGSLLSTVFVETTGMMRRIIERWIKWRCWGIRNSLPKSYWEDERWRVDVGGKGSETRVSSDSARGNFPKNACSCGKVKTWVVCLIWSSNHRPHESYSLAMKKVCGCSSVQWSECTIMRFAPSSCCWRLSLELYEISWFSHPAALYRSCVF